MFYILGTMAPKSRKSEFEPCRLEYRINFRHLVALEASESIEELDVQLDLSIER